MIILIYVAVASFILGKTTEDPLNNDTILTKIITSILWPLVLITRAYIFCVEILPYLPIWDIIKVVIFRQKIKTDKRYVIRYYNKVKDRNSFWAYLKRKTAEKVAKDNNIDLTEKIPEFWEYD